MINFYNFKGSKKILYRLFIATEVFLFIFFKSIGFRHLLFLRLKKIEKLTGFKIWYERIVINPFLSIKIWNLYIKNSQFLFTSEQLKVRLSLRKILAFKTNNEIGNLVEFTKAKILISYISTSSRNNTSTLDKIDSVKLNQLVAAILKRLYVTKYFGLFQYIVGNELSVSNYRNDFFIKIQNINKVNNEISFKFEANYKALHLKSNLSVTYIVDNVKIRLHGVEGKYQNSVLVNLEKWVTCFQTSGNSHFEGTMSRIKIFSEKLSQKPISIEEAEYKFTHNYKFPHFNIFKDSVIYINEIPFYVSLNIDIQALDQVYLSIYSIIAGKEFFLKNPFIQFQRLKEIEVKGEMSYRVDYIFSLATQNKYYLNFKTLKKDIALLQIGYFDINSAIFDYKNKTLLNESQKFNISKYNQQRELGDTCFSEILKRIIIETEDPNFYDHTGVDLEYLGKAINETLHSSKFRIGGSTITMQLARNLFLGFDKNICRKMEEIYIALIIENFLKIDKSVILGIYLSIIKLGNNIYGINNGSQYYFNKESKDLSIQEILVLTYIIPRPDHFEEALLSKSKKLIYNLKRHLNVYKQILSEKFSIEILEESIYEVKFSSKFGKLQLK